MPAHSQLVELYEACRAAGLNVSALSGWSTQQQGYYWYRPNSWSTGNYSTPPNCSVTHHTATSEYTPNVKNSSGQTKANVYSGLARPGTSRLYSVGSGTPKIVFAAAGPANYGNGACIKAVYNDYVFKNKVVPGAARTWTSRGDDGYANRMGIGNEIVHKGDGSLLDPGVFELVCQFNAIAESLFGWKLNQSHLVGHEDSTRRKVDPRFTQGSPYTMAAIRSRVAAIHGGTQPPIPPPGDDDMAFLPLTKGMGMGDLSAKAADVVQAQRLLNKLAVVTPGISNDGKYGSDTVRAVRQAFGRSNGDSIGGNDFMNLMEWAFEGDGGGSSPHSHTFNGTTSTAG